MRHIEMLDFGKKYRNHKFENYVITNGDFDLSTAKLIDIITDETRGTIESILGMKLVDYYNTHMHASRDMMNKKLRDMFKAQVPFASITVGRDTLFDGILDNGYSSSLEGSTNSLSIDLLNIMGLDEVDGVIFYNQMSDNNFGVRVGLSTVTSSFQVLTMVESRQIAYHLSKSWEYKNRTNYRYDLVKRVEEIDNAFVEIPYELPCVIPYVIIKNFCDVMDVDYNNPPEVIRAINHHASVNIYFRTDASVDKPVYMFNYPVNLNMRYESNDYNDFNAEGMLVNKAAVRRNIVVQYLVPTFFRFTTPISTLDLNAGCNYVDSKPTDYKLTVPTFDRKPIIDEHFTKVDKVDFKFEDEDIVDGVGTINLKDVLKAAYLFDYVRDKMKTKESKSYKEYVQFDYVTNDYRDVQNADRSDYSIDYDNMILKDSKAKKDMKAFVFIYIDSMVHKQWLIDKELLEREKDIEATKI